MYNLDTQKPRRKFWIQAANIPKARLGWTLDDCVDAESEDVEYIKKWVDKVNNGDIIRASASKLCGLGLMFSGKPGRGKTTIAAATIQNIMLNSPLQAFDVKDDVVLSRPCYFITFNDLISLSGQMMDSPTNWDEVLYYGVLGEAHDSYNIRILVIDDIGKEHASLSGWQKNVLHHVLRTRFNRGLPTIITTNVMLKDWKGLYGDATESFAKEAFTDIQLSNEKGDLRE